jgi:cytoskeleton protein RodZ
MFEIGNSLREARLRQSLEFSDVERATKIRPKYLRALEDEQFELLPAQTYVKGFLNTYAEFLGLDGQLYVDEYNSRYVTREEEEPFRPRRSTPGPRNRRLESSVVLVTLVGIAVVFGLVIAAWKSGDDSPNTNAPIADTGLRAPAERVLVVRGTRGATRMEVRRNSQEGELVWAGTIPNGRQQSLKVGRKLWLYVQRPAAVDLVVNGRATRAPGRFLFVDASGVERAPAAN